MSAALFLTNPKSAMRSPEQVSMDEWREATAVWGYLTAGQRMMPCIRARVPMNCVHDCELWVRHWKEIKGGLVWAGYDVAGLIHAAQGLAA